MTTIDLTDDDRMKLAGEHGEAARLAMRILVEMAGVMGATHLIDVVSAHIDSCLYHGLAGLDLAERLASAGARVAVPSTLNVSSLDLLHPERSALDPGVAALARRQMDAYVSMGCRPTWTCAPYQLRERPSFGQHIAWAESNAIVFANSVLGSRTNRYGDFLDICAAISGRVPFAGLHRDEERRARIVFRVEGVGERLLRSDAFAPVLGHVVGAQSGSLVPAIVGLPGDTGEDRLKALGAAAASSGAVAMFHAVGITPEAPTLEAALGGELPVREVAITGVDLRRARDELSTATGDSLDAVAIGAPHVSVDELERLASLLDGAHPSIPLSVNTGRDVWAEAERRGLADGLREATIVTDTCTYLAPVLTEVRGTVMTDSAKWAWYAPANLGVSVVFGSMEECVRSAHLGRVWRDPELWRDG